MQQDGKGPTIESTIKRVYDEYHLGDFEYGAAGSDNLNPQREMVKDQLQLMEAAIQELTDEIVRKKIRTPSEKVDPIRGSAGGDAAIGPTPRRRTKARAAGAPDGDLSIFPLPSQLEKLVGTYPGNVNELAMPPVIECNEILRKYGLNKGLIEEGIGADDGEPIFIISTGGSGLGRGGGGEGDDDNGDDDSDLLFGPDLEISMEFQECAKIELLWLKIILIIIKIIQILRLIVTLVIQVIMLLIQIIAQIAQILISLIMMIISMIVSLLLKLLFSLINFDCLGDQTLDLIRQIREAIAGFSTTIGFIDPSAINFFGDLLGGGLKDLKDVLKEIMSAKKEAWEASRAEIKKTFSKENLKRIQEDMLNQATTMVTTSFKTEADVKLGQVKEIYTQAKGAADDALGVSNKAKDKWKEMNAAVKTAQETIKAGMSGLSTGTSNSILNSILSDVSIRDLEVD